MKDRTRVHGQTKPLVDRLVRRTRKTPAGCIEWAGRTFWDGYGRITAGGPRPQKYLQCHRVSFAAFVGEIPAGFLVLHNCPAGDNPRCVNPTHLWLGTPADNTADMIAKGRDNFGGRHSKPKLTDQAIAKAKGGVA